MAVHMHDAAIAAVRQTDRQPRIPQLATLTLPLTYLRASTSRTHYTVSSHLHFNP